MKKLVACNESAFADRYKDLAESIKVLEYKISKHMQLQTGLETIYQLAISVILLCYANSQTKTTQALTDLFEADSINFLGISLSPEFVILINVVLNMISYTFANVKGLRGHCQHFPALSKLLLATCIFASTVARIIGFTIFYAPPLGLFDLLFHYKGLKKLQSKGSKEYCGLFVSYTECRELFQVHTTYGSKKDHNIPYFL